MFFNNLNEIMTTNIDVIITIRKVGEKLTVSTYPKCKDLQDNAQKNLQPVVMTGTADELDSGYFDTIIAPLSKASGLISNLKEFEDSVEKMKASSKQAEKDKAKLEKQMKKVEEAESKKDYAEALKLIREARTLTGDESEIKKIDKKIEDFKVKVYQSNSLFS